MISRIIVENKTTKSPQELIMSAKKKETVKGIYFIKTTSLKCITAGLARGLLMIIGQVLWR
eukprot:scaffold22661_cov157-Skeletonema_dohrnii-CCMP3373.AAC.4